MAITAVGWVAMVVAAVASLGCVIALRPRLPGTVVAAVVMLVAMIDMGLGHRLLPPIGWAAVLVFVGVFVVAVPRSTDARSTDVRCGWHHGLALVAAAVIMIGSPHGATVASAAGAVHPGHALASAGSGGPWLLGLLIAGGYAMVAGAAALRSSGSSARPSGHTGPGTEAAAATVAAAPRLQLAQVVATTCCLAAMAALGLAA